MTLGELLPVRLGMLRPTRQPKHSAPAEVDRLRRKLQWADLMILAQQVQIDDAEHQRKTDLEALQAVHADTVARIDALHAETVRGLEQQIADLEHRLNIACQATAAADQTQEIDPEVVARICGRPVPLHLSPMANPANVPSWAHTT